MADTVATDLIETAANLRTAPHTQPCRCAWCKVDADNREQKRADLARAMGWTVNHGCLLHPTSRTCWLSPDRNHQHKDGPPNPYESAEDSRALVAWLVEDVGRLVSFTRSLWDALDISDESLEEEITERLMTAPLPIRADAAWLAIKEKTK